MIRVCPECGAENRIESIHCRNCGVKLPAPISALTGAPSSLRRNSFLRSAFLGIMLLAIGAAGFWARANMDWQNVQSGAAGFWAKTQVGLQHVRFGTSSALYRWFSKWLPGLEVEPASLPTPAPISASTSAPVSESANAMKIRCPRCGGIGYTVLTAQRTTVDLTKRKHTFTETKKAPCMLCDQKGGRTIILPVGAEICPACYGMGRIVGVFNGRERILPCEICFGKGYIIRKY
jgi:hypothetical protein